MEPSGSVKGEETEEILIRSKRTRVGCSIDGEKGERKETEDCEGRERRKEETKKKAE